MPECQTRATGHSASRPSLADIENPATNDADDPGILDHGERRSSAGQNGDGFDNFASGDVTTSRPFLRIGMV